VSDTRSRHPRTLIIGGGAIGSAIACFLSEMAPGAHITVVERDPTYQSASSSLSASSIRQQFSTPVSTELSRYGWEYMTACRDESGRAGGGVDLRERGYLFLAQEHQAEALRQRARVNQAHQVSLLKLDGASLARKFPWLRTDDIAFATMGVAGEGWFDGYRLQQWFRQQARSRGVHYLRGEVTALTQRGQRLLAATLADGARIEADNFVNAAGPWSAAVARMVDLELPVHARRRTVFTVSCPTPLDASFPILVDSSGVFVRPEQHHYLVTVLPPHERDHDDLPLDPDFSLFDEIAWPALAARIPAFEALRVERAWAGYYEVNTFDHNGLVGLAGPSNFFVATGFSGHGLMHSAGVGRGMAELLVHGAFRTIDLTPLSPGRLRNGQPLVEHAVY
jgi:FAD-dependent oxidoreductase domain-containing protein 1